MLIGLYNNIGEIVFMTYFDKRFLLLAHRGITEKMSSYTITLSACYVCSFNSEFSSIFDDKFYFREHIKCIEYVITIFVFCSVFVGICLFLLQNVLQLR